MSKSPRTTTAPTGNIAPFGLRMLPELRARIEAAAKASGRSMNAEIVARLENSFAAASPFYSALQEQEERLERLIEYRNALKMELMANPSLKESYFQKRLDEVELSIANTKRRIAQFKSASK